MGNQSAQEMNMSMGFFPYAGIYNNKKSIMKTKEICLLGSEPCEKTYHCDRFITKKGCKFKAIEIYFEKEKEE
jgi:hypothetical protein